jgi:hypothetical protein
MSYTISSATPNFVVYSDSPFPLLPSYVPYAGTIVIPGPVTLPTFLDLNKDRRVIKQVTKWFLYKTLDKWLYSEMSDVLNYFKVSSNGVEFLKNLNDYSNIDISQQKSDEVEKIIEYIEHYILTEDTMYRVLKHFVSEAKANWYDLHKNEYFVKDIIHKKLISVIKNTIAERNK